MEYNRKIAVLIYKSGKKSGYLLSKFNHFFNDFFNHFCRWAQQLLKVTVTHGCSKKKLWKSSDSFLRVSVPPFLNNYEH